MKTIKQLLLTCAMVGAVATANAYAADQKDPRGPSVDDRASHLQKSLQLTDDQTAKVKNILAAEDTQRKALHDKYQPQFEAFRADAKKLHDDTQTQVKGVLTPKQQAAFDAQHDHKRFGHGPLGRKGGDRDHDGPPDAPRR
jgi:Spy/CpxP family protein refolding chaperone